MSRRNVITGFQAAAGESLAADFQTSGTILTTVDNVAINVATSGVTDNLGSFFVQHRVRKNESEASDWATLTLDSTPTLADADDVFLINLNQIPPGEIRILFTAAGGTPDGVCDIWLSACSVGA